MNNYNQYPKYKTYGIIIEFINGCFSWCVPDRKTILYLLDSTYLIGAKSITVVKTRTTFKSPHLNDYLVNQLIALERTY